MIARAAATTRAAAVVALTSLGSWAAPALATAHPARPATACAAPAWVGAWTAAKAASSSAPGWGDHPRVFVNQGLRMIVAPHLAGSAVRLRFSNRFGSQPVTLDDVSAAVAGSGAAIAPGSARPVTFGGSGSVSIPAGAMAGSDPASFTVTPFQHLAISFHVAGGPVTLDIHPEPDQNSYVTAANSGDLSGEQTGASYTDKTSSEYALDEVDVLASGAADSVVTLGDSITDGTKSTHGADARWPDDLQRRLLTAGESISVLDTGIGSNAVSVTSPFYGPSGAVRFAYDVLTRPAVSDVIVLEGINDIGLYAASAQQIEDALTSVAEQAHAAGVSATVATLTPFNGFVYYTAAGEATRQAVNAWIRSQHVFDHVVDFDAALRDVADPTRINPAWNADGVHPNDAGYRVMASAIDLATLRTPSC